MTAAEFIEKFPKQTEVEDEDSHLNDMACPNCGERNGIKIEGTVWAEIHPDGTDRDESDFEYDDNSLCACSLCQYTRTVRDFTIKGLDEALEDKWEEEHDSEPDNAAEMADTKMDVERAERDNDTE